MYSLHTVFKKAILHFDITLVIEGTEYTISVTREDIPDMGGHTDFELEYPEGFPEEHKQEAQEKIEAIEFSDIFN